MKISDLILFQNRQLIVLNKPSGLPVQPDKTDDISLMQLAQMYCKQELHLITRIDRPASGAVLFAKTKSTAADLSKQLQEGHMTKIYWVIVAKKPEKDTGEVVHFLRKDGKTNKTYITEKPSKNSKKSVLHYTTIGSSDRYYLLQVDLVTGRHHQIRAQFGALGNPVKGDVKYGFRRSNKDRSIHLHAKMISFNHPVSRELITINAPLPPDPLWTYFKNLFSEKTN